MNLCTPTFPSSPPGRVENNMATVPCSGARAGERHHNVIHDTSGEVGTDVAVNARPRHAHGQVPVVSASARTSRERKGPSHPYPRMRRGARVKHGHMWNKKMLQRKTRDRPSR